MAQVIVFNGGELGGIIVTEEESRSLPPFDPGIRLQMRGISALINGVCLSVNRENDETSEARTLINRISNLLIEQVEAIVGPLDGENALVYQDNEGGFTCGSIGRPPQPFSWPPQKSLDFRQLLTTDILGRELVEFVQAAENREFKISDMLEDPSSAANELGLQLSERTISDLQKLAPCNLEQISNPVEKEVVQFFHRVVDDGRFLTTWATRPYAAATALDVNLSPSALQRILAAGAGTIADSFRGNDSTVAIIPIVVGIVVIVGVVAPARPAELSVRDSSGLSKF